MAEYIERGKLWNEIQHTGFYDNRDRDTMEDFVISIPAEDVAPVVHGWWIHIKEDGMTVAGKCSNCGYTIFNDSDETNYCPLCGAKMQEAR